MTSNPNIHLPAEIIQEIDKEAKEAARWQFHPEYSRDANTACQICYRRGATAYATKLHEVQGENEQLKKELDVAIKCNENLVNRQAEWQQQLHDVIKERDAAKNLLTEVLCKPATHMLIKKFLYGE